MRQAVSQSIGALRSVMDGPVLTPDDTGFDDRRRVWNAGIDRRPAAIARCASAADAAAAVRHAQEHDLEISVRGGAHNTAGTAVCDGGLMIDLSLLNSVAVDPAAQRAKVDGGALLADLDAATQAHGLAVPAGLISHTGVGGLTLGGGMGWLSREFGLSLDNLAAAEVATADGRLQRASAAENPELFWAIRGGGGNFGVVSSFEFQLHGIDPVVQVGLFFWSLDQGPQALRLAGEITAAMPPGINAVIAAVNAPPAPFVPRRYHFAPGYALLLTGFGATQEHDWLASRIRRAAPLSGAMFYRLDGAYSQVADDETAFGGGRSPRYGAFIIGLALDADLLETERSWVRGFWEALRPHAIGSGDGYVNGTTDYREDRVRNSYGAAKYRRLAGIKAEYDPDNVFHLNANIRPAA